MQIYIGCELHHANSDVDFVGCVYKYVLYFYLSIYMYINTYKVAPWG